MFALARFISATAILTLVAAIPTAVQPASGSAPALPVPRAALSNDLVTPKTNAEAFARGLPPLALKRRNKAHRPRQTGSAPVDHPGFIQVTDASGNILGDLGQLSAGSSALGVSSTSVPFSVTFDAAPIGVTSEIDITADTSFYSTYPVVGAVYAPGYGDNVLAPGSTTYAYLRPSTHTDAGSPPQNVDNSYSSAKASESAIFTYDASTNAITAQWINPDAATGVPHAVTAHFVIQVDNTIVVVGDVAKFAQQGFTSGTNPEVFFTYVVSI